MQVRKPCGFDRSFQSLDSSKQHLTNLWCDNQSAIKLSKDPFQHQCNKNIELHMHFIIKLIHDQVIEVLFFPTEDQVADIFTKSLTEVKFLKL
jgi:hypothetical protein